MKNENTPNVNRLLKDADTIIGGAMGGMGCFTILFFLAWPILAIIYLIGTQIYGLQG